jgi:hypothetical protein
VPIIDDAVPLFHHITVGPLMETAFLMVEQYANSEGKRLAGFYHAAAQANGPETHPFMVTLVGKELASHRPDAILLRVKNEALSSRAAVPFEVLPLPGVEGAPKVEPVTVSPRGIQAFDQVSGNGKFAACRSLVDMDEHFDDARRDFRNRHIGDYL